MIPFLSNIRYFLALCSFISVFQLHCLNAQAEFIKPGKITECKTVRRTMLKQKLLVQKVIRCKKIKKLVRAIVEFEPYYPGLGGQQPVGAMNEALGIGSIPRLNFASGSMPRPNDDKGFIWNGFEPCRDSEALSSSTVGSYDDPWKKLQWSCQTEPVANSSAYIWRFWVNFKAFK